MYIEKLDKSRLLITLEIDEAELLGGKDSEIILSDESAFRVMMYFLKLAAVKAGASLANKVVKIELIPCPYRFFLIVTIDSQKKLPAASLKHAAISFDNSLNLIDSIINLPPKLRNEIIYSQLYFSDKSYLFILTSAASSHNSLKYYFSEFGKFTLISESSILSIHEHYDCLSEQNAIDLFK